MAEPRPIGVRTGPGLIGRLLPPGVTCAEAFGDVADAPLVGAEAEVVAAAGERRRAQFATARACARAALVALGHEPVAVPRGERGAPVWPAGIVGSLTHCAGYRAAVTARAAAVRTVGIDAEPAEPLPAGVLRLIASAEEQAELAALGLRLGERLLFCAKEAVYKAWFPLAGRWLGFLDCHVRLAPDGTFRARLLVDGPEVDGAVLTGFTGRWADRAGLLLAAVVVPRHPAAGPASTAGPAAVTVTATAATEPAPGKTAPRC